MTRVSGTETLSPLRGLRPMRGGRRDIEKLPKPRISMRCPATKASAIAASIVLTANSVSPFVKCPNLAARSSTISERFIAPMLDPSCPGAEYQEFNRSEVAFEFGSTKHRLFDESYLNRFGVALASYVKRKAKNSLTGSPKLGGQFRNTCWLFRVDSGHHALFPQMSPHDASLARRSRTALCRLVWNLTSQASVD